MKIRKRFSEFTYQDAAAGFASIDKLLKQTEINQAYLDDDLKDKLKGWNGPNDEGNSTVAANLQNQIKRVLVTKGDLRSVRRRHRRGVVSRSPAWQITPRDAPADPSELTTEQQALIKEAEKILNEFWKNSRVGTTLKGYVNDYLGRGHGVVRPYFVQPSASDNNTRSRPDTIEKAVRLVHLFHERVTSGCIIWNTETLEKASLYRYSDEGVNYIEMSYLDDEGKTVIKTLAQSSSKEFNRRYFAGSLNKYDKTKLKEVVIDEYAVPLNGKLMLSTMTGESLISASMVSQQNNVNKNFTMMSLNTEIDGFRYRLLLNTMPPGEYKTIDGEKKFVPNISEFGKVAAIGAGRTQYATGIPQKKTTTSQDGIEVDETLTQPSIHEAEPIDPDVFIKGATASTSAILEEADQAHVGLSGDIQIAAESMRERREDYKMSLEDTKSDLDDSMSETCETVLAIVAYLMGNASKYDELQVIYSAILNPGPMSADDIRVMMETGVNGYRTDESVMESIGITDPIAMKSSLAREREQKVKDGLIPKEKEKIKPDDIPSNE